MQRAQDLLAEPARREEARILFERVLLAQGPWYRPLAHIGLATLHRLGGDPMRGLEELREAERSLREVPDPDYALARLARWQLREERFRCFLAHGLLDRAEIELEAFAALCAGGSDLEQCAVALAEVDLRLGEGDESGARAALDRAGHIVAGLDATNRAEYRLRQTLLERRSARAPADRRRTAERLEDVLRATTGIASGRLRAGLDAVEAWLVAGDLGRARACSETLQTQPFENWQRTAEILAQFARVELARGAPADELASLRDRLGQAVEHLFAQWRSMPLREGGAGSFWFHDRRDALGALLALHRRSGSDERAIAAAHDVLAEAMALGTLSRRLGAGAPDLATVRGELVPEDGAVLLLAIAPHFAHAILVDRNGAEHVEIGMDPGLHERLVAAARAVASPPPRGADPHAAAAVMRATLEPLRDALLPGPLRARMAGHRSLLLVGDEQFATLVQAMPWGDAWLATAFAVRHAPSTALAIALERRATRRPTAETGARLDTVLLADPPLDEHTQRRWGLAPLALRAEERAALTSRLPAARCRAFFGAEATATRLFEPALGAAAALCIVTHGVQDHDRELAAGLLLAPGDRADPVLFADDLARCAPPPLAVLAVCRASSGPLRIGDDGVHHLGGAMLTAGAEAVVLAGSDLPVAATVDLVGDMLGRWHGGASIAEALRAARERVARRPGTDHPFVFAGLRLAGRDLAPPR